jgi:hypothetical protein
MSQIQKHGKLNTLLLCESTLTYAVLPSFAITKTHTGNDCVHIFLLWQKWTQCEPLDLHLHLLSHFPVHWQVTKISDTRWWRNGLETRPPLSLVQPKFVGFRLSLFDSKRVTSFLITKDHLIIWLRITEDVGGNSFSDLPYR